MAKWGLQAALTLLLTLGAVTAQAQLPVFDGIDWTMDRGNLVFVGGNGVPLRQGLNQFNVTDPPIGAGGPSAGSFLNNDPGPGARRWVWPRTSDIVLTGQFPTETIDNPNTNDPIQSTDTSGTSTRVQPAPPGPPPPINPQQFSHAYWFGAWQSPQVPLADINDYRSPNGGFSFSSDPSQVYFDDYGFVLATHNDFRVDRGNGTTSPATSSELSSLPYTTPEVYSAVQNVLTGTLTPTAVWQIGNYRTPAGRYSIDIYSPGDGTITGGIVHPNVTRALVRVSWGNQANNVHTVDAAGNPIKAGVDDPRYSRIYLVDLGVSGWIHLQGGGLNPAAFDYDGTADNQLVVTLYTLTPDDITDTTIFGSRPLVTADACRFIPIVTGGIGLTQGGPNPYTISTAGRILGPVVGTNKFRLPPYNLTDAQPLFYVAREESVPDPTPRIPLDPTQAVSATNPLIPDPALQVSAPVFYCIDNQNGDVALTSTSKVRWRYIGYPDTGNGSGTATASPLLTNVRCRDGVTRTILYFVTTNSTGGVGHIYALDPVGDRIDPMNATPYNTTTAYWVYPSYRPLTTAQTAAFPNGELPAQYNDPNYNAPTTGGAPPRVPVATTPWGIDQTIKYVDGDIIRNPAEAGHYIVRSDTQITFGGVQSSPLVVDDPINPGGAQVLILGNMNGRVYAFDAGGRGDFLYDKTAAFDITKSLPGTTQRYWTWPHFGADAYHALNAVGSTRANLIHDEPSKIAFPASPAYDPNYPAANLDPNKKPIFIGAAEGHMYALSPGRDNTPTVSNTNDPIFNERRIWVYPDSNTQTLGAAPSTVAIFPPGGLANSNIYFTCAGRVYALKEAPALSGNPTNIQNTAAQWVYPATNNPPFPNPTDSLSAALDPGFNGSAPMLVDRTLLGTAQDFCYVVQGDGTVYGLNAANGNAIATGQTLTGGSTRCTPIASLIRGQAGFSLDTTSVQSSVVFADDDGIIWAIGAVPDATQPGPITGSQQLPLLWAKFDSGSSRLAAASLANGMIVEGDENGQLRAYGVGTGFNGLGETVGIGEPPAGPDFGAGDISIDLRGLNFYNGDDYRLFQARTATPARRPDGSAWTNSRDPILGNINNGAADQHTWPVAADWGDYLYVAAHGVYHAMPQDNAALPTYGTGPPTIRVTFTITQPGRASREVTYTVPMTTRAVHGNGSLWPDDQGITYAGGNPPDGAEHGQITIYGIDPNAMPPNTFGQQFTGPSENVYPWVALIRIPIQPDSNTPYVPGNSGYNITAFAEVTQVLHQDNMPDSDYVRRSNYLRVGQHDYPGLRPLDPNMPPSASNPVLPTSPNQITGPNGIGLRREIFITNPLGVTVRGVVAPDMTNGFANVIGFGGSAPTIANILDVLGNGNRVNNPLSTTIATSPIKPIYAPLGMIGDGSTGNYTAIDNAGNKRSAFFVVDRSNLWQMTNRALRIHMIAKPIRWNGGPSSVMNPLPWEQHPTDVQDSRDYPNIATNNLEIANALTGESAIRAEAPLTPPIYQAGLTSEQAALQRQIVPTEMKMTLHIPKYQPANVNHGISNWRLADGTPFTFGEPYTDISGNARGTLGNPILGPLLINSGVPVAGNNALAFPAAGYVSEVVARVIPPGTQAANLRLQFNPQAIFNESRGDGTGTLQQAYRALELGATVPPNVKMRVVEQTIDVGKEPHGTGYSDHFPDANSKDYRVPFAPNISRDYLADLDQTNPLTFSPWDDATQLGAFFRPFTLINESNVNLYDVRMGKLLGQVGSGFGPKGKTAVSARLISDQSNAAIFAAPFLSAGTPYAGNIGIVSSFDHLSSNSASVANPYDERSLWPLPNPYVQMSAPLDPAIQAQLNLNAPAFGVLPWLDGIQPHPTVHKARVGDTQGTVGTVPDQPYDAVAFPNFTPKPPRIGLAIPLGTPVGTYQAPIFPYEDNVPLQWQEWLFNSSGLNYGSTSHDGIVNVTPQNTPIETTADPTFTVKATVREARLTEGVTSGTLSQIDSLFTRPLGANLLPSAAFKPFTPSNGLFGGIALYWATNRQPNGSPYLAQYPGFNPALFLPKADAPYSLAFSFLAESLGGWQFSQPGTDAQGTVTGNSAFWWNPLTGNSLFPGYDAAGQPNNVADLFPSTQAEAATLKVPFLPGVRANATVRHASPNIALRVYGGNLTPYGDNNLTNYVFWFGQIGKGRATGATAQASQITESRTFYARIPNNSPGGLDTTTIASFLNDPALTKLSPKAMYLTLPASGSAPQQDLMYLFWHAGNGSQTSLYYNFNTTAQFPQDKWSADTKLPTPGALVWQSDPSPVYHQATDPQTGQILDVIDIVYTGVLKNRKTVEVLLTRYAINRTAPNAPTDPPLGALRVVPLPMARLETMTRAGATNTYGARDAAWAMGTGTDGILTPSDVNGHIEIYLIPNGGALQKLNARADGTFPTGQLDPASGLVYFNSSLGGQIVVDTRSGTISFPQIQPKRNDIVLISYTPQVMRLNTSRDESNIDRSQGFGNFQANDPAFTPRPAITAIGSHTNPIAIYDRYVNERGNLTAPQVVFNGNAASSFPRLWTLYRKTDASGTVKSSIYYKAMRLMVRLPRSVKLTVPDQNGNQQIQNLTVGGATGAYEVDWIRGRIYFTELDEGKIVTVSYTTAQGGNSGNLTYRVAWGDEISAGGLAGDPSRPFVDETTPEVVLPTDSAVNEGQVTAFQIPPGFRTALQGSEVWVFWTSTRSGTTDLFYETISPLLYPLSNNQR